jgi:polysaccharide biosynthesis protein PslG
MPICRALALALACLALAIPSFAADKSAYGVMDFLAWDHDWNQHHYASPAEIDTAIRKMKEAGVGFVRMDFLWQDIEPKEGFFSFDKYDAIVDKLSSHGIGVVGLLSYNAPWTGRPWNAPPDVDQFTTYAIETAEHFKGRVRHWEIWNEPDDAQYWHPQDDMKTYTELLKETSAVLKQADPETRIVLGGLSKTIPISLRKIYKHGGKEAFDVVNFHPFTDPRLPNALAMLEGTYRGVMRILEANGDAAKPIWFTELGCPGVQKPDATNGWWLGTSPTEAEQAEWVRAVYGHALSWPGVEKVFWAFFRDTPHYFGNGIDSFGLVRRDFSEKPSFKAYKESTRSKNMA